MTSSEQLNPKQVKELVYTSLKRAIMDREFEAGEPLRENALTERFGVSKTPIREALVRLAQEGLVEIAPYRGARVKRYTRSDLRAIYDAREIIEAECVRRAAGEADPGFVGTLRANVKRTEQDFVANKLDAVARGLDDFDTLLLGQLKNAYLADVQDQLNAHIERVGQVGQSKDRFALSIQQHQRIVDAIAIRAVETAVEELRHHLNSVMEDQLVLLEEEN